MCSYTNPSSLLDSCLESFCNFVYSEYIRPATPLTYPPKYIIHFKDDVFIPEIIAEKLLKAFSEKDLLNCITAALFDAKTSRLRQVRALDASKLLFDDLKVFCGHNLKVFHLENSQIPANEILTEMNVWSNNHLEILNLSKSCISESFQRPYRYSVNLEKFKNLRELDVSSTEFHSHNLIAVVEDLQYLESLNISDTKVDCIAPLKQCSHRLKKLGLAGLQLMPIPQVFPFRAEGPTDIVLGMTNLQHLDVSNDRSNLLPFHFVEPREDSGVFKIIDAADKLPNLVSLDVSGQEFLEESALVSFLEAHPHLQFLGLLHTDMCSCAIFNPLDSRYRPHLKIAGTANVDQIIVALKMCKRANYLQASLFALYSISELNMLGSRPDILELVLRKMKVHRELSIQLASTACLYNLTKWSLNDNQNPNSIPQNLLVEAVSLTLDAMERFPNNFQLQKNALLTLCNDRILQETPMDRFRCAQVVLDSLCSFTSESTDRLCVAISSIVASKISSVETAKIGSDERYMLKLLQIVRRKVLTSSTDSILGFTLSTLWNLSDESPKTCTVFLDLKGLPLFTEMLYKYKDSDSVLTKILGLLNNIAEVEGLRKALMNAEIIESIRSLLKSNSIEISYFSGGVLAHLLTSGVADWDQEKLPPCYVMLNELEAAVLSWKQPNKEMVAYRSFKPFLRLLLSYETYQAQLWALWAIQHVLAAHGQRYSEMLIAEGISKILYELAARQDIVSLVSSRARVILDQLVCFETKKITKFEF